MRQPRKFTRLDLLSLPASAVGKEKAFLSMLDAKVVVCGTLVADVRVRPFHPVGPENPGGLRHVEEVRLAAGGLVANTGMALARMGTPTLALGRLGDDPIGTVILDELARSGLGVDRLHRQPDCPTSTVLVCVDPEGERTFHIAPGANPLFDLHDLERNWDALCSARAIVLGYLGELPALDPLLPDLLARLRRESDALLVLETAGPQTHTRPLLDQCLPALDVFFPSWREARELTGCQAPAEALRDLARGGSPAILGLKLGHLGSVLWANGEAVMIPPIPVPVMDATGAGDVFLAGLLAALLDGQSPQVACTIGNYSAGLAISTRGGAGRIPPLSELLIRCGAA